MSVRKVLRSLKPGDDRALAARDYAGQPSASETASQKRRAGHRRAVLRDGDDQKKVPKRLRGSSW